MITSLPMISEEEYGQVLSDFLKQIGFRMPSIGYDSSLEQPVVEYFARQPWDNHLKQKAAKMAKWMSTGLGMCYPYASRQSQIAYGIHATFVLFIDDIVVELGKSLDHFQQNLVQGKSQEHSVLQSLVDFLALEDGYLGSYGRSMMLKSTIEFVSGCIIERDYDGKMQPPFKATKFPDYLRQKTGYTEPYAHFVYPEEMFPEATHLQLYLPLIQDLCEFISYGNDILSFFKESVIGNERLNYICNVAFVNDISPADALRLVCHNVVENIKSIRTVLSDHPSMLKITEEFLCGYIAWYINQDRYHLTDITVRDIEDEIIQQTPREPQSVHITRTLGVLQESDIERQDTQVACI
jgi:hypothetical protein